MVTSDFSLTLLYSKSLTKEREVILQSVVPWEVFGKEGKSEKEGAADVWSQECGAGWIISAQHPHNYQARTSGGLPLTLLNSPLNPLHCSAVKSTSSPADYSPPSAAFITKFMMKQFCVLLLQWSRYQGQTCSQGTEYTSFDCMNTTVRTSSFTPLVCIYKSLTGWGRMTMMMRLNADKKRPPDGDPSLAKKPPKPPKTSSTFLQQSKYSVFTYDSTYQTASWCDHLYSKEQNGWLNRVTMTLPSNTTRCPEFLWGTCDLNLRQTNASSCVELCWCCLRCM